MAAAGPVGQAAGDADRGEAAMTAGVQKTRAVISVSREAYDELVRRQQEFREEHDGGTITMAQLVDRLVLADRKPMQP